MPQTIDDVYHIYAKDRCLYHNLEKKDFNEKWELLNVMVGILKTAYTEKDLSYEKIGTISNSNIPGEDSY